MRIEHLMVRNVATVSPANTLSDAANLMRDENIGCVVVVDGGRVVGVLTDRDITIAASRDAQPLSGITVGGAMSKPVHSVQPGDDLAVAAHTMRAHRVRRVPVVDAEARLVGIITLDDLAREALAQSNLKVHAITPADVELTLATVSDYGSRARR